MKLSDAIKEASEELGDIRYKDSGLKTRIISKEALKKLVQAGRALSHAREILYEDHKNATRKLRGSTSVPSRVSNDGRTSANATHSTVISGECETSSGS